MVIPLKNVSVNKAPFIKPSLHVRNDKLLLLPAATAGWFNIWVKLWSSFSFFIRNILNPGAHQMEPPSPA